MTTAVPPGGTIAGLLLAELPPTVRGALLRCAVPTTFDEVTYNAVLRGADGPPLATLCERRHVERPGGAGYRLVPSLREAAWARWWTDDGSVAGPPDVPDALARFGREYGGWQRRRSGPVVEELRGLVLGDQATAVRVLRDAYGAAEAAMDLPHARDLLLVLTSDPQLLPLVGPELARVRDELQRRLDIRSMWRNAHATGTHYLHRPGVEADAIRLLDDGGPRVLRLAAAGGMGKSTTLAWFIAHHCVPAGVPCALVDLDWVDPMTLGRHPWLMLLEFAAQLDVQMEGSPFLELLGEYGGYRGADLDTTTADGPDVLSGPSTAADAPLIESRFLAVLAESPPGQPVLLVVDTVEEAMLRPASDPGRLLAALIAVVAVVPQVRLIVSGRLTRPELERHSAELSRLVPGGVRTVEIPAFTPEEATGYLRRVRGISDDAVVDAVVRRAELLPWQLALCADHVVHNPSITPDEVEQLDPGLAWAIDRVVGRVRNDALQWLIRYAVVLRRVRRDVAEAVLLPVVVDAMRGTTDDDPDLDGRPAGSVPVFRRDGAPPPDGPDAFDALWTDLLGYAAGSSWVEMRAQDLVVLHPSVVEPLRALLRDRPVRARLHAGLATHFERRAAQAPAGPERTEHLVEAVYHRFQLSGPDAAPYWRAALDQAHTANETAAVAALAAEVVGPEYLDEDGAPRETAPGQPIVDEQVLAIAYLELAWAQASEAQDDELPGNHRTWGRVESNLSEVQRRWHVLLEIDAPGPLAHHARFAAAALYLARGLPEPAIATVRLPDSSELDPEACRALLVSGEALDQLGRRDESTRLLHRALVLARNRSDLVTVARCTRALGRVAEHEGRYEEALYWARSAEGDQSAERWTMLKRLALDAGLPALALAMGGLLGAGVAPAALAALGAIAVAVAAFERRESGDRVLPTEEGIESARAHAELLDLDRALGTLLQARETCLSRQDHDGAASCSAEAARIHLRHVGSLDQARQYLDEGMRFTTEPGSPAWTALRLGRAELAARGNDLPGAAALCDEVLNALRGTAAARARLLSASVTGLALTGEPRFTDAVLEHLEAISPATARLAGLAELVLLPSGGTRVDLPIGPPPDDAGEEDRAWAAVRMAEVHRVAGRLPEAAASLTEGTRVLARRDSAAWWAWLCAMDRIGPAGPDEPLPPPLPADLPPLLRAAYETTLGHRRFRIDGREIARQRAVTALELLDRLTRTTVWHARAHELAARADAPGPGDGERVRHQDSARAIRRSLDGEAAGAAPVPHPDGEPGTALLRITHEPGRLHLHGPGASLAVRWLELTDAMSTVDRGSSSELVRHLAGELRRTPPFGSYPDLRPVLGDAPGSGPADVRLAIEPPRLVRIPWELLRVDGRTLITSPDVGSVYRTAEGARPERVRNAALQRELLRAGAPDMPMDGVVGRLTRAAIRDFQRSAGLDVDGVAGPGTWAALLAVRRSMPQIRPRVLIIAPETVQKRGDAMNRRQVEAAYRARDWVTVPIPQHELTDLATFAWQEHMDVVHICAGMSATDSLPHLSLDGGEGGRTIDGLPVTFVNRMVQVLAATGVVPLVVLDVATPPRDSELIRQLLARNDFADQLVQLGVVETVLAAGLAEPGSADRLVSAITGGHRTTDLARVLAVNDYLSSLEVPLAAVFSTLPSHMTGCLPTA